MFSRNLQSLTLFVFMMGIFSIAHSQTDNTIFKVEKASLSRDVLEYSPLYLKGDWVYTQLDDKNVNIYSLGSDKVIPIEGFSLRRAIVTGFAKSDQGGLIAISYGDNKQNVPAKLKGNKIYFAFQDKNGIASKYFEFQLNSEAYSCTTPYLSPDGTKLYFASDMPGGYGGLDIYVCDYRGKEWSKPRNLGPKINSEKDEVYPYMIDNMLFFSSNGHGANRMDIFIADMDKDLGRLVINAGSPINSPADDYSMSFDNNTRIGYFLSDREGVNGKAFKVTKKKKLILLNIKSNEDKKAISGAKVDLSRCRKNPLYANSKGSVILPVAAGEKCFIQVGKVGYNSATIPIDFDEIIGLKKSININLSKEGVFYQGRVVDQDNNPADEVELSIVDQATGELQYVFTDDNGYYTIALEPLSYYMIRSKSPYYNPSESKIVTLASVPADILGTIKLVSNGSRRSGIIKTSSMDDIKVTQRNESETENPSTSDFVETGVAKKIESVKGPETSVTDAQKVMDYNDNRLREETVKEEVMQENKQIAPAQSPVIVAPKTENKKEAIVKYAIQLAAISLDNHNLQPYQEKTRGRGQVYIAREGNLNKVRLGFYETRQDALAIREQLPEELRKGFIVEVKESEYNNRQAIPVDRKNAIDPPMNKPEKKAEPDPRIQPENKPEMKSEVKPQEKTNSEPQVVQKSLEESRVEYKIRLSTLRNASLFNGSAVRQYGLIEEIKTGNLTTFYLSGFENKEEVKQVIDKVKAGGFPSAQIVKLTNGEYTIDN